MTLAANKDDFGWSRPGQGICADGDALFFALDEAVAEEMRAECLFFSSRSE